MKRYCIFIFIIFCALNAHSFSSYKASYDLFGKTDLGFIKFGSAEYELLVTNSAYVFTSNAQTNDLWRAIYDYSRQEISIGLIVSNKLVGDYYKVTENQRDSISDNYEINIYHDKQSVSINNETILETNPGEIVDALSVYLKISEDIQKFPNQKDFTYQLVSKKGVSQRKFSIDGFETININGNEVETIKVICPELKLIFNISMNHNYMPVFIDKTNGKANYKFILKDYNK